MVDDGELGPALTGRLAYLLKRALRDLHALHDVYLEPTGVTYREMTVLLLLDGRGPESQLEAARRLDVDRTTMVALLDGLEEKTLVARHPDTQDRRRNVVELTDTGRATLRRALRASDRAEAHLLAGLEDGQADELRRLLALTARATPPD